MARTIHTLGELERHGGSIHATCRRCGRVAIFATRDLGSYYRAKGWDTSWPEFARKLRCHVRRGGCGSTNPTVAWWEAPPPNTPAEPVPPLPRMTRNPAPIGVNQTEWDKARDDRDRRQLIRRARG